MNNAQIAAIFDEMADLLEFQNANPFRVRAYRNGARTIRDLPESLATMAADESRQLTDIDGIGKDLAEKIVTLLDAGELEQHQELLAAVPSSVLLLLRVPGLGPKKAAVLYKELQISTLDQLRAACEEHRVRELKGFGEKTEQTILQGLEIAGQADHRMYWAEVDVYVRQLVEYLRRPETVQQLEVAGSYRAAKTIGDLDILVDSSESAKVMDYFGEFEEVAKCWLARYEDVGASDGRVAGRLRVVPTESWCSTAILYRIAGT